MDRLPLLLTPEEIITESGGDIVQRSRSSLPEVLESITLDSRQISERSVFLCHSGSRVDAHSFIDEAASQGCPVVIGERKDALQAAAASHPFLTLVHVNNAQNAAHRLASAMRRKTGIPVISITGACGKTTTKDLTGGILRSVADVLVTPVNNNNLWGVPLILFELRASHQAAVIELGTNEPGEVGKLAPIVDPTIAFTTSIGPSHLMNFGSVEGVLAAETEHIEWLISNDRNVLYVANVDDPVLEGFYGRRWKDLTRTGRILTVSARGKHGADIRVTRCEPLGVDRNFGSAFSFETPWGKGRAELPVPGNHNISNALAAIALSCSTGLCNVEQASIALASPALSPRRSELKRLESGALLLNDSYNANPLSVASALNTVSAIRENPLSGVETVIAVLGDMLELGEMEKEYHLETAEAAARAGVDVLFTTGTFASQWVEGFEIAARPGQRAVFFDSRELLFHELMSSLSGSPESTLILVKGSNSSRIFEIADRLKGQ